MNLLSGLSILPLLTSLTVETVSEKDAFRVQDKNEIGRMVNNLNVLSETKPNDPYYSSQWNLDQINYKEVFDLNKSDADIKVAIIDAGIDNKNPDSPVGINLTASISFSDFFKPFNSGIDTYHGTAISGIIAAKTNNSKLISGISPNVEIISVACGHYNSEGDIVFNSDELVDAINYCSSNKVDIINYSIGGLNTYNEAEKEAIENFPGLFVTSAGNYGLDLDSSSINYYPAEYNTDNMIVVGATTSSKSKWVDSNYGKNVVDIFAPGCDVPSICSYDYSSYYVYEGTSFAVPHVVGVAASLLSEYPDLTTKEVKNIILSSASKVSSLTNYCSIGGILDASKIIHYKHDYSDSYEYIDTKYHYSICECGAKMKSGHVVAGGAFDDGNRYATCLLCGGRAEMGFVVGPNTLSRNVPIYDGYELIDGLYYVKETQVINGIINLSYNDYKAYLNNGELYEV